jgi:two-component system NarL family sensor kinase
VEAGGSRVGWVVVWVSLIASLLSSLSRWMEAEGEERQQMKWFACALLVFVFAYPFSPGGLLLFIVLALLPIAVGIAILKYRLYHLDIIINRARVYGILPAMLALVYFGGVTATQAIFRALTGPSAAAPTCCSYLHPSDSRTL